jgi:hypothetical protein
MRSYNDFKNIGVKRTKKQTLNQQNQGFLTNEWSYWILKWVT